jgi:hypothetical protein
LENIADTSSEKLLLIMPNNKLKISDSKKIYLYTTDKTIHSWYEKLGRGITKEDVAGRIDIKIIEADL